MPLDEIAARGDGRCQAERSRRLVSSILGAGNHDDLLFGHRGQFAESKEAHGIVWAVAFSPDGRWLASAGADRTIRLWPVPDVSRTPLHKRPYAEFLTVLRSHTNMRAVPDPQSPTGWKLEPGPFPGWAKLPEW